MQIFDHIKHFVLKETRKQYLDIYITALGLRENFSDFN